MSAQARSRLWRAAEALSAAVGDDLSPRARRLSARDAPALSLEDLAGAPDWAIGAGAARRALARMAGAVAMSRAWRRTIEGTRLRRAGAVLGEAVLDAVTALPDVIAPAIEDTAAEDGSAEAIDRLGGRILIADGAPGAGLAWRLRQRLQVDPAIPLPDRTAAAAIRRAAEGVLAQLEQATAERLSAEGD